MNIFSKIREIAGAQILKIVLPLWNVQIQVSEETSFVDGSLSLLKFIYSEKATKFSKIFPLLTVKSKGKISQNFVARSEYINEL